MREVDARWYGTAHHVGVLERRPAVLHLDRLVRRGLVIRTDGGYLAM